MRIVYWWLSQKERVLWRQRRRQADYIKMDLLEIGWDGVDYTGLAQIETN
jgi:hypothetical protein